MTENNIVELGNDTLFYIKGDGKTINGVGDSSGSIEFITIDDKRVGVYSEGNGTIDKVKLKKLCIAWLALNYPTTLNMDDPND